MKLQIVTVALLSTSCVVNAFTSSTSLTELTTTTCLTMSNDDQNSIDRRGAISQFLSGITLATTAASVRPAFARREPLPEYLTEPTDEFKESERQRDEFRRQQLVKKRQFTTVLDRLTFESKTEEEIIKDLKELRFLVIETEGLPLGIKRDELIKIIRAKKAKGFWPTNVEIAYQKLTSEIAYQQSPNREKDVANPL